MNIRLRGKCPCEIVTSTNEHGKSTTEKWRTMESAEMGCGKNHQNMEGANGDISPFPSPFPQTACSCLGERSSGQLRTDAPAPPDVRVSSQNCAGMGGEVFTNKCSSLVRNSRSQSCRSCSN